MPYIIMYYAIETRDTQRIVRWSFRSFHYNVVRDESCEKRMAHVSLAAKLTRERER